MKRRDLQRLLDEAIRQAAAGIRLTRRPDTGRQSYEDDDRTWDVSPSSGGFVMPDWVDAPKKKPLGAPREYDHDAIRQAAETYIKTRGLPRSCEQLMVQVRIALSDMRPPVYAPERSQLQAIVSPIFKRADEERRKNQALNRK